MKKTLFINEDDSHFTSCHPRTDMTRAGIERLADFYCENTQVAGVLFCVNYQKALYPSQVWEYVCGGYDPDGPDDQPFLRQVDLSTGGHGRHMLDNMLELDRQGLDRHQLWIDRCRHHGVEGWLTLRMNDCHGLQEYRRTIEEETGDYHGWALMFPSEEWKAHPEWRRAIYREECSLEGAFDFGLAEVREHHLKLVAEVLDKWDMDGIELDWLRWGMNFRPGFEAEGRALLTGFMAQVRKLVRRAEQRLGHPVKLGVRIPAELAAGEALGYDPLAWSDRNLIDQVVLSWFAGRACFDQPVQLWRRLLGPNVRIICHCDDVVVPYSDFGITGLVGHDEIHYGVAATNHLRGADGHYFFNTCYFENDQPERFKRLLQQTGDPETLRSHPRRHVLTHGTAAPGLPARERLPIPLRNPAVGYDYNRLDENAITLRLDTGHAPAAGDTVTLYLGFSERLAPETLGQVRGNGQALQAIPDDGGAAFLHNRIERCVEPVKQRIPCTQAWRIPPTLLADGENVFELIGFTGAAELRWCEVRIHSDRQSRTK